MKFDERGITVKVFAVAPARERGLKLLYMDYCPTCGGRSREGAWIEMPAGRGITAIVESRSREGAWIEIASG